MGIAGSSVAKDAAAMILMNDNFASIVTGKRVPFPLPHVPISVVTDCRCIVTLLVCNGF